jgi:hypothetical protein
MTTDAVEVWRNCFRNWPADLPRRGVLVTSFNEQVPFENFSASDQQVLIERRAPDTVGARMVMVPYQCILALKIVDVVKPKAFSQLGFDVQVSKK